MPVENSSLLQQSKAPTLRAFGPPPRRLRRRPIAAFVRSEVPGLRPVLIYQARKRAPRPNPPSPPTPQGIKRPKALSRKLAFAAYGLDQGALPLGFPFSPKGRGAGENLPAPHPIGLGRSVAINGSLRRVLTRSVLAVPAALRMRLPRPPLTATPLKSIHKAGKCHRRPVAAISQLAAPYLSLEP